MKHFFQILVAWGLPGIGALAFVESLGIPNPSLTDFMLIGVAAAQPSEAFFAAALAVLGSMVGSVIFFYIMHAGGEKLVTRYVSPGRAKNIRAWFQRYGLITVFVCAFAPIPGLPLKAFSAVACLAGVSRARFLWVIFLARVPRYAGLAYLGAQLGDLEQSKSWIKAHTWHMAGGTALLFLVLIVIARMLERSHPVTSAAPESGN